MNDERIIKVTGCHECGHADMYMNECRYMSTSRKIDRHYIALTMHPKCPLPKMPTCPAWDGTDATCDNIRRVRLTITPIQLLDDGNTLEVNTNLRSTPCNCGGVISECDLKKAEVPS